MRSYLLVATVLPLVGLSRLARDPTLYSIDMLAANAGDAVMILVLLAGYLLGRRCCAASPPLDRLNRSMHVALAALALSLVIVAELLYVRSGEILDIDIIRFAIGNFGHIHGAVGSVLGWLDLAMPLAVLVLAVVVLPAFRSRPIRRLQALLLIFPWALLTAHAAYDAFAFDYSPVAEPIGAYQGRYANWNTDHEGWLSGQRAGWKHGILTGIAAGKVFTRFDLQLVEQGQSDATAYSQPTQVSAPTARYNVMVVVLESIRHNVLGAFQGKSARKSVTPFIDTLAAGGWRVDRAYTTITHTTKALVGIYCGTFPRFSPLYSEAEPGGLPFACLPRLLASVGYATGHFQTAPAEFEERTGLLNNLGFETQFTQSSYAEGEWRRFGYLSMDDRAMVGPAVSWMQAQQRAGKPFLASVLTVMTHHPYSSPVSERPIRDPESAYASYIDALGYTDKVMAELFAEMKKSGLLENTLVIITGDHGEAFSEHGLLTHNGVAFEEGMRVPMILWGKMLGKPKIVDGLRQHLDVVPTIFDLLGMNHDGALPGMSLLQEGGHQQLISSCFYKDYCLDLYDAQGGKTMYFYGKRTPAHYDLKADALELADQLHEMPADLVRRRVATALSMKKQFERLFDARP